MVDNGRDYPMVVLVTYRCPRCQCQKRYRDALHGREALCLYCWKEDQVLILLVRVKDQD